jgi:hypothetical protein
VLSEALFSPRVVAEGVRRLEAAVSGFHTSEPLRPGIDVEALRQALPPEAHPALADALIARLVGQGRLVVRQGIVARPDFQVRLSDAQQGLLAGLTDVYRSAGLAPPALAELPAGLRDSPHLWPLLRILEVDGRLVRLEGDLFVWGEALEAASGQVRRQLAGRSGLGPADFKDVVPVTRKHLLPILAHFDQVGVTLRRGNVRDVPSN